MALLSYLTTLLHRFPGSSDFDQRDQEYELKYLKSSRHAQRWQSNKPDGHLRADAAGQIHAVPVPAQGPKLQIASEPTRGVIGV